MRGDGAPILVTVGGFNEHASLGRRPARGIENADLVISQPHGFHLLGEELSKRQTEGSIQGVDRTIAFRHGVGDVLPYLHFGGRLTD